MIDYADRFVSSTYADDEPVCLTVHTQDRADRHSVSIPESLFARAQAIASAYKLHLLPTLEIYAETSLDKDQCATLLDEVRFIGEVTNDQLLGGHLIEIAKALERCVTSSGAAAVLIEGP